MSETRTVRLGDVCQVTMGQAPKGDTYNTAGQGYPLIAGAGDFDKKGGISVSKYTTAPTRLSEPGSIIMSIRASIGDTVWSDKVYCLGRGVAGLQPGPELDSRFLWYWLPTVKKLLLSKARGATFVQVNRKDVEDLPLNLPPLEEQRRFAEQEHLKFLIKQKREHQQELLKEFQIALFHKMFSGKDWPMKPLGEVATVVSGATPKTSKEEFWGGEIQWVTPAELSKLDSIYIDRTERTITAEGLDSCAAQVLPVGSVLLSSRAPIGLVAINTVPMATNQGFKSLIPGPELDSMYLYFWLKINTPYLQSLGVGATFKELSKSTLSKIKLPIPPKTLQQEFKTIINHFDSSEK